MSTSRLALVFSVMLISAVGCRSMASTRIAVGSTSPAVSSGVGVGIVEGPSPGTFVVIDGMATDGETTMSRIVQLSRDGSVVLKTLDYGVVAPIGWRDASSGAVRALGVQCASVEDDDGAPMCPEAPLVLVQVTKGDVSAEDLAITTSSDIGFSAAPDGSGIVIVAFQGSSNDNRDAFQGFRLVAGRHITDLGATGPALVCADSAGALVVPRDLGDGETLGPVRRVVDDKLVDVSPLPEVARAQPSGPAGGDQWSLEIYEKGSWNAAAKVQSLEAPRLTTFSGKNAAFVVVSPDRNARVHLAADVLP